MKKLFNVRAVFPVGIAAVAGLLGGCGSVQSQVTDLGTSSASRIAAEQERADRAIPVVTTTSAAWLMGQAVQVVPAQSPMLARVVTYHPAQRVSLSDVAAWISQSTGIVVDTVESQAAQASGAAQAGSSGSPVVTNLMTGAPVPSAQQMAPQLLAISYEGTLAGLLDVTANKAGLFWKFDNGRLSFYKTETKTFYLPAIARSSTGSSAISTSSGAAGGGGGSGGGQSGGQSGGQGGQGQGGSSGGQSGGGSNTSSSYVVDVWADLEKTAKVVGGSAQVVANTSLGSVTVTGTPAQVRNVEEWVKGLADNLSQQVAITVQIYKVKATKEENYNWNPNVVFQGLKTKYGFALSGPQAPPILSGNSPFNLTANVLSTATGGQAQYTGSQLAFEALSSMGQVNETMRQTIVTLNGQPETLQLGNQRGYLASTTAGQPGPVGTTPLPPTLTPGLLSTGFTGMFLPRIVNGKILLSMNLTSSTLLSLGSVSSGGSSIQTPNIDISTFQQNVTLTPGDSLMLTGIAQDSGSGNKSGVGAANNYLFGGGTGSNAEKQLIAIVITAKVL